MLPEALPYHLKVRDYFKQQTSTWEFFAAARTREEQLIAFKTDLLKNTYQFRREAKSDRGLYEKVDLARDRLGLGDLPVTVYQAPLAGNADLNASIVYIHKEAHIVFSGPILERLSETELLAVIAHELTHVRLYTLLDGDLEVADRIITAIANNYDSEPPYYETARLFKLYTEIYCDRGAYTVTGEAGPVIASLLKISTGLAEVNVESYTTQAEAIFSAEPGTQSAMPTHPENYIRARALKLWEEPQEIAKMIEGQMELDRLDLFSQRELNELTRLFLQEYLRPKWFQSTLIIGLAKQYFSTFAPAGEADGGPGLAAAIGGAHPSIRDYFSYVLLDFVLADPSLEEMPAGRAFELAGELQLTAAFDPIYKKELQLSDKKWQQHKQKVQETYLNSIKD
ncbi:MAG: M48 family metalloprotease [Bacteroidetes bacterium]|nr:M48 family metalloprotease [Bacteroidota bacterium]